MYPFEEQGDINKLILIKL